MRNFICLCREKFVTLQAKNDLTDIAVLSLLFIYTLKHYLVEFPT